MIQKATADQPSYNQHGALLIKTTLIGDGVSLYIADSAGRVDELSKTFTDLDQAATFYRHVAQAAEQGKRVYQIVWEVQALEEAQNAATGRTANQIADAINADADLAQAETERVHNATVEQVQDVLAESTETYAQWKATVRKRVTVQANRTMARFAQASTTRAANLTPAQDAIVTQSANAGGRIVRGGHQGQATSSQILALNACGLVDVTYTWQAGTRVITGAQLTTKGFKHAGVELGSAA